MCHLGVHCSGQILCEVDLPRAIEFSIAPFFVIGTICRSTGPSTVKILHVVQTKLYEKMLKRPSSGARDEKIWSPTPP